MSDLPPGFVLDGGTLPQGFVIDQPKPSTSWSMVPGSAVNNTLVNMADSIYNTPTNIANLGIAGYGAAKGLLTGSHDLPNLLPYTNPARSAAHYLGLPLSDELPLTPAQKVASGAISGGVSMLAGDPEGAVVRGVRGAIAGGANEAATEATGNPMVGLTAGLLAGGTGGGTTPERAVTDATNRAGINLGMRIPPSELATNPVSKTAYKLAQMLAGGKAAMSQEASIANRNAVNRVARSELGIGGEGQITENDLEQARQAPLDVYAQVRSVSPDADQMVDAWRQANFEAKRQNQFYQRTFNPAAQDAANAASNEARQWDQAIDGELAANGRPDLVGALRDARVQLGKIGTIENLRNPGTGDVDARGIAALLNRGAPLSTDMASVGRFAAANPKLVKPPGQTEQVGVHGLLPAIGAAIGGEHGGPAAAMGALVPGLVQPPLRSLLLSKALQKFAAPGAKGVNPGVPGAPFNYGLPVFGVLNNPALLSSVPRGQ